MKNALKKLARDNARSAAIEALPIKDLVPNSVQPRGRTLPHLVRPLAESIKAHGQLYPGLVARLTDGRLMMIDCHRRREANAMLGNEKMQCRVLDGLTQKEAEAMFWGVDEPTMKITAGGLFQGWATSVDGAALLEQFKHRSAALSPTRRARYRPRRAPRSRPGRKPLPRQRARRGRSRERS
jgi:hypothetical protein